jgi:hypothetical protein
MRDGDGVAEIAVGHIHGMGEFRVAGDGVDEVEIRARQLAGQLRGGGTFQFLQHRQSDEIGQRLPIAGHALGIESKLQGPEGGGAKGFRGGQRGDGDLRALERQAAVGEVSVVATDSSAVATSMS